MNLVLTVAGPLVGILAADGPPLRPGRDEARSWAERELARTDLFDHRVVNVDLEAAARAVAATVGLDLAPPR